MTRLSRLAGGAAIALVLLLPAQVAAGHPGFSPGAPGAGDPYYPLDGNGGYDVRHYDLDIGYVPSTAVLTGVATISARATQNLSRFDLDLVGLTVRSIRVDGRRAAWSRDGQELVITPAKGIGKGASFEVVVRYDGVPQRLEEFGTPSGFLATDDGFAILGQPHGAAHWFPANDHPTDKASFTFEVTVPRDLQVVANGRLVGTRRHGPVTTWSWDAPDPMATYLATVDAGRFNIHTYKRNGIRFLDAIDPDLYTPFEAPHPGTSFAYSRQADSSYKRLMRTILVPAGGGELTFRVTRDTEPEYDFFFVEAHHPGVDDWTTLPEQSGITTDDLGASCYGWADLHPFIAHYQSVVPPADPDDPDASATCEATGTTGVWNAAAGAADGAELWTIDLGRYAGGDVEVSLSYASDASRAYAGVAIDDVTWPGGGTSFEADADPMDGWTVPGAPDGSPGNDTDWIVGDASILPPTIGDNVDEVFAQQPEILRFLASQFGPYPFATAGGIVDDTGSPWFALETQTRPVYAKGFFTQPDTSVPAHELTHQWYGDSLTIERWSDLWLNEGFATYAEWLWSEHQGGETPQALFDDLYGIPDDDPFWKLVIADPGRNGLADYAIYARGAMTLQVLRTTVGDDTFFRILRGWAKSHAGGNVNTQEFIRYAERVSGQDLDALFNAWLYTPSKPVIASSLVRSGAGIAAVGVARGGSATLRLSRDARAGMRK
jgi:hypothetical protein